MSDLELFKEKFKTKSTRLRDWDYSNVGWYYVTICTKNRECFFGDVVNGNMVMNDLGRIVFEEWLKIEKIRNGVELDVFQVMPNHIHGIVIIMNDHINVETHGHASLQLNNDKRIIKQSLSNIIRGFKGSVTAIIRSNNFKNFAWQSRFYDHIVRNEKSLLAIQKYIKLNPLKWEIDKENPNNN